ncbi:uncharacterized protein BDZ99DRAFT_469540 [Mytilinidion resinicola]|uniref:CID domain-containing protein n=1 Tax=Mytilinidion resinicola TaxID=574789 RepID=A0A6A6XZ48_9PEZI|nr:uncharacterized protein BDZ99DRAFT_469540 [Mytilinidion resinicola]KAF2801533.1 hypothetical protein BDZ99DRAFT_469540 [Mytilinidion resinicola]
MSRMDLNHKFKTCLDLQLPNSRCPAPRRRVHILYLINDLLHSAKYHRQTPSPFPAFRDGLKQTIEDAVKSCAGGVMKGHPTTKKKLLVLLNLWQAHNYYSADLICTLREIVEERPLPTPTLHGFTGVAWHDQPAGLMVPILLRNPDAPVDTLQIRPMDVQLEQASEALKTAVDELLQTANDEHNGGDSERAVVDIDEMGHRLVGDGTRFVNYYGWSEGFCRRVMSGGAPGQGGQFGGRGTGH